MFQSLLLHIPHSSTYIPDSFGNINDYTLMGNVVIQTDLLVDDLFYHPVTTNVKTLKFIYSRFYCDVERYWDDKKEPMSLIGQGVYYKQYSDGSLINRTDSKDDIKLVYNEHHSKLNYISQKLIAENGSCLIIDCHSFTPTNENEPDICIGVNYDKNDPGPETLWSIINHFIDNGYKFKINYPFSGSIYPSKYLNKNLKSIMIEVNKNIYLGNEIKFSKLKNTINELYHKLLKY